MSRPDATATAKALRSTPTERPPQVTYVCDHRRGCQMFWLYALPGLGTLAVYPPVNRTRGDRIIMHKAIANRDDIPDDHKTQALRDAQHRKPEPIHGVWLDDLDADADLHCWCEHYPEGIPLGTVAAVGADTRRQREQLRPQTRVLGNTPEE